MMHPGSRRAAATVLGVLSLVALGFCCWFAGLPRGLPAWMPLAAATAMAGWAWNGAGRPRPPRPSGETLACLAVALAYRVPAIVDPWGWVNRDGAYGAFVAMHLRRGLRPAPVFTEGANYQGTLKGHLAAALSLLGVDDWSLLIVLAGVILSLLSVAAGMALARRIGGRAAAVVTGLYLALGPRFLVVFSLNSVGQYVDVLALGGLALALIARAGAGEAAPPASAASHAAAGFLLGAAFWQQPVALSFAAAAVVVLALRRGPGLAWAAAGFAVGALPVVLWNAQNGWASGDIMGRDPGDLRAQADALPRLLRRTLTISFPILAGVAPGGGGSRDRGLGSRARGVGGAAASARAARVRRAVLGRRGRQGVLAAALPAAGGGSHRDPPRGGAGAALGAVARGGGRARGGGARHERGRPGLSSRRRHHAAALRGT
jgi:hypothetical protein